VTSAIVGNPAEAVGNEGAYPLAVAFNPQEVSMTRTASTQAAYDTSFGGNAAENYERYFVPVIGRPFGVDLVTDAALEEGERVLDVACGTGIIARLAAERVAPTGSVSALDVNAAMLNVARSLPAAIPIKWYETAAESAPLPDSSFDVVFCQIGLQFVADKAAAVREMHRVLRPGGRLFISTPMPNAFFDVLDRAIARRVSEEASAFVHAVFSLNDPREMRVLLTEAGFDALTIRPHAKTLQLPPARDFMWQYIYCTPLMALLPQSGNAQTVALERDVVAGWQPWVTGDGITYEQAVLVSSAQRPAMTRSMSDASPALPRA
jgi:ubiquinone/menaquinone biosynthesis C-methylase UbiE